MILLRRSALRRAIRAHHHNGNAARARTTRKHVDSQDSVYLYIYICIQLIGLVTFALRLRKSSRTSRHVAKVHEVRNHWRIDLSQCAEHFQARMFQTPHARMHAWRKRLAYGTHVRTIM